ncbi:hypothetical protein KFZ56_04405 [Virgibacillus sp. NKC19-3]|uniref:hypothetical protein n=1 Tax=Virgibacillus saliphilus TaxID=2831674 RepID=UPI001C9B0232|nr:hypothetical protein [Virgibacillus sp. NKC19-3]MBY7142347.1 hypothetical protein [Virgibacillus sp. NKC19-3]
MRYDDPLVAKEAKKYKKLFETFTINPGSFRIDGQDYFFINFYKWKKITDCAVVCPTSEAGKDKYLEAFDALLEYSQAATLILTHGGDKASANMDAFTTMQKFLLSVLNEEGNHLMLEIREVFDYCLERINLILSMQKRVVEIYNDFQQKNQKYHDGYDENVTRRNIDETVNYLGELDFLQYQQIVAIYEYIPKFNYIKELNNPEIKKHITTAVKTYLAEFSKGEKEQLKNIESVKFQTNMDELTKEEHIERAKEDFYKNLSETNSETRRLLRYPK